MYHFKDDDSNFNNNNNFDDDDYSEVLEIENSQGRVIVLGILFLIFFYTFLLCMFYIKNKTICSYDENNTSTHIDRTSIERSSSGRSFSQVNAYLVSMVSRENASNSIEISVENIITEEIMNNYAEKITINHQNIINYFDKECSICYNVFEHDDQIIKLNICEHYFHSDCIIEWFKREIRCPLCNNTNFEISHQIIS
tara:strand:- start:329 stop:919 length:591 start_codon:yes stop_codon:yes gene_type:complete